ncbi:MAG: hypothetical protein E4G95_08580 [Bacteroidia bacterium]|nr:MAG: hypothetical protein E4G95_08580 [Bacteroidia bacterium]
MKNPRLLSLDIFRGITIAFMIIVNNPGSWKYVYPPLRHAAWDGCTPTDLVFPAFLFIVGVSMWFSMRKYGHALNRSSLLKILYRTSIIFLAGFLLHLFPFFGKDLATVRIMGVLQRIALAYGFGALACMLVKKEHLWILLIALLGGYYGIMLLFGGSDPFSLEGNFSLRVDRLILGEAHLYRGFGIPFDPEGLLGTIPAIGTVIIGFLTGGLLGKGKANAVNVLKMVIYGAAAIVAGIIFSKVFPLNKPLWSSSYVLYTGGISMLILAFLYLVIDVLGITFWTGFFRVFGVNALFIYILAGIWVKILLLIKIGAGAEAVSLYSWIYNTLCVPVFGNLNGSLFFAILQVLILWVPAYLLYRKKIFIKV